MKSNFLVKVITAIITAIFVVIIVTIGWIIYGSPDLTDSERFLLVIAIVALTIALRNDIKEESK